MSTTPTTPDAAERIEIDAPSVGDLLVMAIQSPQGNAWWRGFVAGHGYPEWVVRGDWRLETQACAVILGGPEAAGAQGPNGLVAARRVG